MLNKTLSIQEVLRYATHDFLNQLNLIQMNLDLQRIDEAKQIISSIAAHNKVLSNINKSKLWHLSEWLQTFTWRFPAIDLKIESNITKAVHQQQVDESIVQYLENTVIQLYESLDVYTEQLLTIDLATTTEEFRCTFHLIGNWTTIPELQQIEHLRMARVEMTNTSLHFVICARLE